jgi:hypothetical protein
MKKTVRIMIFLAGAIVGLDDGVCCYLTGQ